MFNNVNNISNANVLTFEINRWGRRDLGGKTVSATIAASILTQGNELRGNDPRVYGGKWGMELPLWIRRVFTLRSQVPQPTLLHVGKKIMIYIDIAFNICVKILRYSNVNTDCTCDVCLFDSCSEVILNWISAWYAVSRKIGAMEYRVS